MTSIRLWVHAYFTALIDLSCRHVVGTSDDLVNETVKELLLDISSQFNAFRLNNDARLSALESLATRPAVVEEATSSQQTLSVTPIVAPMDTPPSNVIPAVSQVQTNAVVSSASIRMLERDMPTLSDENFSDWLDHAVAYAHTAGWGEDDVPQVYKDKMHASSKIAREFLYNKLSVQYKQRVKIAAIATAAELWGWLNKVASVSAERTVMTTLSALLKLRVTSDESITEFSVRSA